MRPRTRARWSFLACAALARAAISAEPEERSTRRERAAYLLRIDGADAYFDLGRADGAGPGDRVRVLRTVRALSPGTRAAVEDRFVLGEITIAEAGAVLSRARPEAELLRSLRIGDRVELERAAGDPRAPIARAAIEASQATVECAAPPPAELAPDARAALGFRDDWLRAQELSAPVRIHYWNKWLKEHPATALSAAIEREVAALQAEQAPPAPPPPPPSAQVSAIAPRQGFAGDPLEVVLAVDADGTPPAAARLNWRPRGQSVFQPIDFAPDASRTLRAQLPAQASRSPGVEWYADAAGPAGSERDLAGSAAAPRSIDLLPPPGAETATRIERSRAGLWVDYVDWNHFKGNDQYWNVEGEFLYRVLGPLYSVRMGFGVYQGWGESLSDSLQDEREGVAYRRQRVGYNYGFTELEFHASEWFGVMGKLLSGVNRDGFLMGIAGSVRIGREQGTSLTLSSGFTPGIGNRNEIALAWDAVTGFPMSASVIVSNEPVQADYGVRLVYQVGRRLTDFLDLSVRASYQLRDINHNGFGLGLAQTFHW